MCFFHIPVQQSNAVEWSESPKSCLSFKCQKTKLKFSPSYNLHVIHYHWWNKLLFVLYILWIPSVIAGNFDFVFCNKTIRK